MSTPVHEMKAAVVLMTPDWAGEILDRTEKLHGKQRIIVQRHLEEYERMIRNGDFPTTGQTIVLDEHERVLDGKHRLTAIRNTGIGVQVMLVTGADSKYWAYYDQGATRTSAHMIGAEDVDGEVGANQRLLASVALRASAYEQAPTGSVANIVYASSHRGLALDRPSVLRFYLAHKEELLEAVACTQGMRTVLIHSHAALAAYAFLKVNAAKDVRRFFFALREGHYPGREHGLDMKDPIHQLRERLLTAGTGPSRTRMVRVEKLWATFLTWNRWAKGEVAREYLRIPRVALMLPSIERVADWS